MSENKAIIFDIVRSSFVDGPGIRTTVFFKGCNLKCAWCHNPESQNREKEMMFYMSKCTGCGKCKDVCPYHLEKCDFCGKCEIYCPNDARRICGKEMTVDEVFAEIIKDKVYYENSDGGVTFSGGECMLQIDFLVQLLKECHESNIHTAIDTAGYVAWEQFEKVLPYTSLFLYDIKTINSAQHKKFTGVPNELILDNLKKLFNAGADVWIRIPVIDGVNDSIEEMEKIKSFLNPFSPKKVELLPYHKMGEHKYLALGKENTVFNEISVENLKAARKLFTD